MRLLIYLFFTTAIIIPIVADAAECGGIVDRAARQTCYEAAAKENLSNKLTERAKTAPARALEDLRSRIDETLLNAGLDVRVLVIAEPNEFSSGKLPQLVLFGFLNRPLVYQIIVKTNLIQQARAAGFKSLDAFSESEGHWIFDLSGAGQTCARDLCF